MEIAFGQLGISEQEFIDMTWRGFVLKQRGFINEITANMKFTRLQTWYMCKMHADPKKTFPEPNKFMPIGADERIRLSPEQRKAKIEEMRKYRMK